MSATTDASFEVYVNDGVLGKPTFTNRGTGYIRSTAAITGNGFAEEYQLGSLIKVKGLTRTPGPGDNVEIFGINDQVYRLVKVQNVTGSIPALEADVYIYPTLKVDESPAHNSAVTIRQFYSQVRLTGHDFLDIGTGNVSSTKYPNLYLDGIDSDNTPQQQNEAVESGWRHECFTQVLTRTVTLEQANYFKLNKVLALLQLMPVHLIYQD